MLRFPPLLVAAVVAALVTPALAQDPTPAPTAAPETSEAPDAPRVSEAPKAAAAPVSHELMVGGKSITVPNPAGYFRLDGVSKDFDAGMAGYIPATHRMLAYYSTPEDLEGIKNKTGGVMDKTFNLQVLKAIEFQTIGSRTFAESKDHMKRELDKSKSSADAAIKRTTEEGNAKVKKDYGVDTGLNISGTAFLGYFEDSDAGLGFSMALKTTEKDEGGKEVTDRSIAAMVIAPVNGRLLSFYANFPYKTEDDRQVAEKAVASWRDAVAAANPRVEGPGAPESQERRIGKIVGTFVGVGVAVAVFVMISKKRAAKALAQRR